MRAMSAILPAAALAVAGFFPLAAEAAGGHRFFAADEIAWSAGPASLPPGAESALLYGDPAAEGLFALRLKMPDGYRLPPHLHGKPEAVTVISGAFRLGVGEEADWEAMETLSAGAFFVMEPGAAHYVEADGETVVQLNSVGPWSITYVDSEDDPRKSN